MYNWWPTPASSADINPMESVERVDILHCSRHVKLLTKKELAEVILEEKCPQETKLSQAPSQVPEEQYPADYACPKCNCKSWFKTSEMAR